MNVLIHFDLIIKYSSVFFFQSSRNISRERIRESTSSGTFRISECPYTAETCKVLLQDSAVKSSSAKVKAQVYSKIALLEHLKIVKYMPLQEAYDEYLGMIPEEFHPSQRVRKLAIQLFLDTIMTEKGLPVIVVNPFDWSNWEARYLMLYEEVGKSTNAESLRHLSKVFEMQSASNTDTDKLDNLAGYFRGLYKLLASTRERAILVTVLSICFSSTSLRSKLNLHEDLIAKVKNDTLNVVNVIDETEGEMLQNAEEQWKKTVKDLEESIEKGKESMALPIDRTHVFETNLKREMLENKIKRLQRLKMNKKEYVKRTTAVAMKEWKKNMMRQTGKGKGKYIIDRGAELAVYKALEEQLVAHSKRTGVPVLETQQERRLHDTDLLQIANKWLEENGKRKIKSVSTVRSWSAPKNKRSIQSRQHRGRSLFKHKKPMKNITDEHINLHYNRAHIKYYHRKFFSSQHAKRYTQYVVRRLIDDKAYLRCGTSEGFSRPRTKPITLTDREQAALPAYDFPEECGYVAPGVNLIIHDFEEIRVDGRDKFAAKSATISTTCKPKMVYPSSATNWANDMYSDRLEFMEEHDVPGSGLDLHDDEKRALIFLCDSLKQFLLMNIEEDYSRIFNENENHLNREVLRLKTLEKRLAFVLSKLESQLQLKPDIAELSEILLSLEKEISAGATDVTGILNSFKTLGSLCAKLRDTLKAIVPQHRPYDFQTSDAGPGVGTKEMMVRMRLTESFLINDLDIQVRFHFAPRDSKTHKVEQVMSALNEAAGDGRFIDVPHFSLIDEYGEDELVKMTNEEKSEILERKKKEAARICAARVAERYKGSRCMGTTIHAKVPEENNLYHSFYFDEIYMLQYHKAPKGKKDACAGSAYMHFLERKQEAIYIRYNNGIEGIRLDNQFRGPEMPQRIQTPVPNLNDKDKSGVWHYHNSQETIKLQCPVRSVDDFCPVVQLHQFINSVGEPKISLRNNPDGSIEIRDTNDTWSKISVGLREFIDTYVGSDLETVTRKEAEKIYLSKLKRATSGLKSRNITLSDKHMTSIMSGPLKLKITRSLEPKTLPWNGTYCNIQFTNTCTFDNHLYWWHTILLTNSKFKNHIEENKDEYSLFKVMLNVHELFCSGKFAEGKHTWLKEFHTIAGTQCNTFGTEYDFYIKHLGFMTETQFTTTCTEGNCPKPVSLFTCSIVSHSEPVLSGPDCSNLEESITKWLTNKRSKRCTFCPGMRQYNQRSFVNGPPLILPVDISNCPWAPTEKMVICSVPYTLQYITYGNGGHFCSCLKIKNKWYLYDGLKEYHRSSSGLQMIKQPKAPERYHQNYCVYAKDL